MGVSVALFGLLFIYLYVPARKWFKFHFNPLMRYYARRYRFTSEAERQEESNLFVASTIMRDACDLQWLPEQLEPPQALLGPLDYGTVVHVNARHIPRFIDEVLPQLQAPIVLVSGCETVATNAPGYERIIESPKILHWYLQNYELDPRYEGERVTKLPLGMLFYKRKPFAVNAAPMVGLPAGFGNQQLTLKAIREQLPPPAQRPARAIANFHLSMDTFLRDKGEAGKRRTARMEALRTLRNRPEVHFQRGFLPRNEVWRRYRDYAFEISPHGNGLDCFRTWEALLLKTIPIVKRSSLDSLYDGLPVVIVDSWEEVTEENLKRWQQQYAHAFDGPIPERLYSNFWLERFRSHRKQALDKEGAAP